MRRIVVLSVRCTCRADSMLCRTFEPLPMSLVAELLDALTVPVSLAPRHPDLWAFVLVTDVSLIPFRLDFFAYKVVPALIVHLLYILVVCERITTIFD